MRHALPGAGGSGGASALGAAEALAVEAEAFWAFQRLMARMEGHFSADSRWVAGLFCVCVK